MADEIVSPDDYEWTPGNTRKGYTKYRHLLDGNARKLHLDDYPQFYSVENMRVTLNATARKNGLVSRSKSLDSKTLLFQVTGKRE
jgi:hypothetical protein